ncbi:hypothetical protein [Mesotoga prima]|uniref:hypothetical protein n=1 Tax=Mesotoga prima TaxID=1184387 RepID=UPI0002C99981|nr:hypothetical protein [Mesotoga prima]MCP5457462.1 hypothetical protein [Thermotogota bacterium]RLL89301.1 DNA polymerase III gamma/tau subunits-like protein [Mesotoga sp. HF07.pep.5.2.highcov]CCU83666.1 DNA polymerase III gamma/tau subunits-like protein [Mesotoga infera]MCP5460827.1 hypothetical protein [Thermotogota bacterium]HOZ99507.1 hypothetical protein [Mesotoga prima]
MQWFDGVVNDRLSRLLTRSSGISITLVGRDSEYLKVLATSIVEGDPKWSKRRYVEDFLLIEPESGNIGIDRIRDIEEIMLHRPSGDGKKYVLIHQCERMTDESANAFLKILEEPPSFATLIMTTTSWQSLLPTIRSRTVSMRGEVPRELMDELRAKYGKRVPEIFAASRENFTILRYFLEQNPDSVESASFEVPSDLDGLVELIKEDVSESFESIVRKRRAFVALSKNFISTDSFFSTFRRVSSVFTGSGSFERARELVKVVRSILSDAVIASVNPSSKSVTNLDLIEWLVDFDLGKEIMTDFIWCDRFLRQRTSSLSSTLVALRALNSLSRNLLRRENGGN